MPSIPPPPPLPPGTVVPQQRVAPPPMPGGNSYSRSGLSGTRMPTAPPMAVGGAMPPPPPPLPPGTVVPQHRPTPPTMPAGRISQLSSVPQVQGTASVSGVAAISAPAPVRRVLERPANGKNVQFPNKVSYFEGAEDAPGERQKSILRIKEGQMVVVYKTDDPHWWLGKVGDDVGWIGFHTLQEIDPSAPGRQSHQAPEDTNPRIWDSKKQGSQITAAELDMEKTDFGMTNATTFDHHGSKIAVFFIQVSGVRKNVKEQGGIWVVAKTLKAFNRLRVAWEEDYGTNSIPVEPPPARWDECSEADWTLVKGAALRKFLDEVKQWPNLKYSQDLKHFLTTDRVNLSGGMISKKAMKPYLDAWVKTSSEPSWTMKIAPIPSKEAATGAAGKPSHKTDKGKKAAIPGLRAGDESFGQLTSRRPKLRRSGVFRQLSALAAVTKQEAQLEKRARRGWTHAGLKLQLLIEGGDACSLKRRSERNVFYKYFAEDGSEDVLSKALTRRAGYNQMKPQLRYNLEKVVYGRMENLNRENGMNYAVYAKHKEQEKLQKDSGVDGQHKRGLGGGGAGAGAGAGGHHKKNSVFQIEALAERLENATKKNEMHPSKQDPSLDRCQYVSKIQGRLTMPIAAQLMALNELSRDELDRFLVHIGETTRPKIERMKEVDSFLEDKRVRCHQLVELLDRMHTPDERLLVVLTCCARLTDAVEAEDHGLFKDLECSVDALNLKRARLAVEVLMAEAKAEDASRGARKAAREVRSDVQRARKALGFLSKAVEKIRSGTIKTEMFEELKERLEAAADAAHEEYCDAVKDAKPSIEFAEEAMILMESAQKLYVDLDELGTGVRDRIKVIHDVGMGDDTEESLLVSALEVLLTIASNAHELASRAADNARFDLEVSLEEVANAEKIIRRVELEERRARSECDAAEEAEDEIPYGGCAFGEWAGDMREHALENLAFFRKDGKYRLHLDKTTSIKGTEDMVMMATLLSRVQLLRDLKALKLEARAEEQRRLEQLMLQSSIKRRKKSVKRQGVGGGAPSRHAPLRQQSSLGLESSRRAAPMRQQSDLFSAADDGDAGPRKGKGGKSRRINRGKHYMGEIEDQVDEDDEDRVSSDEAAGSGGSGAASSYEDGSLTTSDVDSLFGSDLNADDDDLAAMRRRPRWAGGGGVRDSMGMGRNMQPPAPSIGGGPDGLPESIEGTTRRHDRMRQSLIGHTLGTRASIGVKSMAKSLAPPTPRHDRGRRARPTSTSGRSERVQDAEESRHR